MSLLRSADAILPIDPSGPGSPILRFWLARMLVSPSTSAPARNLITQPPLARPPLHPLVPRPRILAVLGQSGPRRYERLDRPRALCRNGAADRHSLVHQRRQRHAPAVARISEHLGIGDAGIGEVDLVELGLTRHLPQRSHLDTGRLH